MSAASKKVSESFLFSKVAFRPLARDLASGATILVASQYGSSAIALLATVIATRLLGPTEYGVAALIISYPTLLWSFVSCKPVTVTTRYVASSRAAGRLEEVASLCKLGYGLDLIASLLVFAFIGATGWWVARQVYNLAGVSWLMILYGASLPFSSLTGTSYAVLSSWQRFRVLAAHQLLERVITFALVSTLLLAGYGVAGFILAAAVGQAVTGIASTVTAMRTLRRDGVGHWWKASLGQVKSLRKELAAFYGWNYLLVTLTGVMAQVPLMLLGRFRGVEEAGLFRLATTIATAGSYPETSLGKVAYPGLCARWGAGERLSLNLTLKRWTLKAGLPAGILLMVGVVLLPLAVPAVFGQAYVAAVPGTQMMLFGAAVGTIFFWQTSYYYASGRIALLTKAYGAYVVASIGLGLLFIRNWGFAGMAAASGGGRVLYCFLLLMLMMNWRGPSK